VVDHTSHDTTSVLSTIEQRFGLAPLSSRDAAAAPLTSVFAAGKPSDDGELNGYRAHKGHGHRRH
jgi:phospholipase C